MELFWWIPEHCIFFSVSHILSSPRQNIIFPNGVCWSLTCDCETWMCGLYFEQSKPAVASFQLKFLCRCASGSLYHLEDSPSLGFNLHIRLHFRRRFMRSSWVHNFPQFFFFCFHLQGERLVLVHVVSFYIYITFCRNAILS